MKDNFFFDAVGVFGITLIEEVFVGAGIVLDTMKTVGRFFLYFVRCFAILYLRGLTVNCNTSRTCLSADMFSYHKNI